VYSKQWLRDSTISVEDGFLGPFEQVLNVGETQRFCFGPGDAGPFWMTDEQREETRLDRPIYGATPKPRSKRELYDALLSMGVLDLPK
jgi:hypothetical protein